MLISAFDYRWYVGAIAVTGIVLAAIYVLWAYQKMFTGPNPADLQVDVDAGGDSVADLGRRELGVLAPLMLALVLFGFYPTPLLDVANPSVGAAAPAHGRAATTARRCRPRRRGG